MQGPTPMADERQYVMVPKSALAWLFGEGPDANGHWFGDGADVAKRRGAFWWRTQFRNMIDAPSPAPAVDWEKVGRAALEACKELDDNAPINSEWGYCSLCSRKRDHLPDCALVLARSALQLADSTNAR